MAERRDSTRSAATHVVEPHAQCFGERGSDRQLVEERCSAYGVDRTAEIIALRHLTAVPSQHVELILRLDTFRDDFQVQAASHRENRADDGLIGRVGVDVRYEGAIDFERVER